MEVVEYYRSITGEDIPIYKKRVSRREGDTTNLKYYFPSSKYFLGYTKYYGVAFERKDEFLNLLSQNKDKSSNHFNECIVQEYPVYEFYDIDNDMFGEMKVDEYVKFFLERRKAFNDNFKTSSVRISQSHDFMRTQAGKKSIHLIIRDCVYSIEDLKNFVRDFSREMAIEVDMAVYHNYRMMRTIYSTKEGECRPFLPWGSHPLNEYFIQYDFYGESKIEQPVLKYEKVVVPPEVAVSNVGVLNDVIPELSPVDLKNKKLKKIIDSIQIKLPDFKIVPSEKCLWRLERVREGKCPSNHSRTHLSENAFIWITDCSVYVSCFTHRFFVFMGDYKKLTPEQKIDRTIQCNRKLAEKKITPLIRATTFDSQYVMGVLNTIQDGVVNVIKSPTGSGKTVFLKHCLQHFNNVLCISFRRTFAVFIAESLGLNNYMDKKTRIKTDGNLILSVEQIWKLSSTFKRFDLMILDEFVMILEQLMSRSTCKTNLYNCQKIFTRLFQQVKTVIVMDANIMDKHIELIYKMRGGDHKIYQNISLIPTRKVILSYSKEASLGVLLESLKREKVAIPYTISKHEMIALTKLISPDKKGLSICRDTKNVQALFSDMTTVCKEYDYVAYTNTLLAGVSIEDMEYKTAFGFFSKLTTSPPEIIQMLNRFRGIEVAHIYIDERSTSKPFFDSDQEIEKFLELDIQMNGLERTQLCSDVFDIDTGKLKKDPVKYISFLKYQLDGYYNQNYMECLFTMLKENRWEVVVDVNNYTKENQLKNELKELSREQRISEIVQISESSSINYNEAQRIQESMETSRKEDLEYCKYKFLKTFKVNENSDDLVAWMDKFNHSSGYSLIYKMKNLLRIHNDPLVSEYRTISESDSGMIKKFIPVGKERTCFFLEETLDLPGDVVNIIYSFLGEDIGQTLQTDEKMIESKALLFYDTPQISIDTVHSRYRVAKEWVKELGFKNWFDTETAITEEEKDERVISICDKLLDPQRFDYICKIFGQRGRYYNEFASNVKNKNTTILFRFIKTKLESLYGVIEVKSSRFRELQTRKKVYNLGFIKNCPSVFTEKGERPCLYWKEDLEHLPRAEVEFLKTLESKIRK